ncbi:STAS domain-containing protein [Streptomyces sp. NPDC058674]|uniref:STAS domain-containing protein n=1 Tax=Streptomyces sp. NPDC058674 TaxID=3346592 RepID=UPI0036607174
MARPGPARPGPSRSAFGRPGPARRSPSSAPLRAHPGPCCAPAPAPGSGAAFCAAPRPRPGRAAARPSHRHLLLDLEAVTFCDSSGFNALIGIYRCAKEAEGSVTLAAVPDRLERLLNLTGLSTLLPAYPTTAQALNAHDLSRNTAIA